MFHLPLIVFAGIQVHQTQSALTNNGGLFGRVEAFLIVVPCVAAAAWLLMVYFAKQLYAEFGLVLLIGHAKPGNLSESVAAGLFSIL